MKNVSKEKKNVKKAKFYVSNDFYISDNNAVKIKDKSFFSIDNNYAQYETKIDFLDFESRENITTA